MLDRMNMLLRGILRGPPKMQPTPITTSTPDVEFVAIINGQNQSFTNNLVIASLYPLLFACGLPKTDSREIPTTLKMRIIDKAAPKRCLAEIDLNLHSSFPYSDIKYVIYKPVSIRDTIIPSYIDKLLGLREKIARIRLAMMPWRATKKDDFQAFPLHYLYPRPVVLVSIEHGSYSNLFPMALIGPLECGSLKGQCDPPLSFALRSTSHSISNLIAAGKFAVADTPYSYEGEVIRLGEHHKESVVDWEALDYGFVLSETMKLKVPEWSLRIREMQINKVQVVGSHHIFLVETVSDKHMADAPKLGYGNGRRLWVKEFSNIKTL